MSIGMEGEGPNPRIYSKAEYDALSAKVEKLREALDHIVSLSRALRVGGPDPMDLEGLSNALEDAVDTAYTTLAESKESPDD